MGYRFGLFAQTRLRAVVVAAGLAVAILVATACAAGGATPHAPTLTLRSRSPVTVVGRHFAPRVRVRITVTAARTLSRRATPNGHGTFTARFATVIDRCSSWSVTASQRGQAPVVIRGARPQCAPASPP
jgi:hypothetical protein